MAINVETIQRNNGHDEYSQERPGLGAVAGAERLASFIYHDLRHPLTAILAYSEILAENDLDRLEREDFYQEIRRAVSRMNDLISLLMQFSKDPESFRLEVADIPTTVKRAIQVVAVRQEFRRIAISYEHQGFTEGRFDVGGLQQVITNIVLNACEAVPSISGSVEVRSSGQENCIEITVSDNGVGIPAHMRHSVFQPFVSYGKAGGTELGLAIVQKILRAHGGDIFLDATGQRGTRFRLVLPLAGRPGDEPLTPNDRPALPALSSNLPAEAEPTRNCKVGSRKRHGVSQPSPRQGSGKTPVKHASR